MGKDIPWKSDAVSSGRAHFVSGRPIMPPFPEGMETLVVGMGCFWGAEQRFWETPGVWATAVGYSGGSSPAPDYHEVCTGATGHAEVVLVVFDPGEITLEATLGVFWDNHDPTQGMRQGNDMGTQYRSCIFVADETQRTAAVATREAMEPLLVAAGFGPITTQVSGREPFHYAEEYHQQYLAKNPAGYCGLGVTGITCPVGALD